MTFLVTGATGNIGSLVTHRLIRGGHRPRVFVRDAARARALFGDEVDMHVGDLARPGPALRKALAGSDGVFLLNSGPRLAGRDRVVVQVAVDAGVKHMVKLSTLDVRTGVGTGPWHARGEDAVRQSGMPYTFIQSAAFMSNVLGWAQSIATEGVLRSSTGQGRIAFIHPDDLADVITHALTTGEHMGESLVVTGPEALSYAAMAAKIGAVIGKEVRYEELSDEEAHEAALGYGGGRQYADALVDIWRAIRDGRLTTVSDSVERILGRKPLAFDRWLNQNAEAFQ
ncbi:NAD(P)H-binding protein [Pyxidicoccus caerfyrddinensis]|uniref:NmrA family NAD(P)-binding protein n=1 Tax=Pyxidicoccus caerfyrddinensis TaxID=2709663 RepID=UPI0013DBA5B7|nr:NAD(P)H-binding protein [Pyxidicoccus caerfyrddinensis]